MKLKNIILFSKSRIKFKEETNISVRYNEEFVKSRIYQTEVLHESFYCQKWSDREIVFDVKRNSLEFCYAFDLFTYSWQNFFTWILFWSSSISVNFLILIHMSSASDNSIFQQMSIVIMLGLIFSLSFFIKLFYSNSNINILYG